MLLCASVCVSLYGLDLVSQVYEDSIYSIKTYKGSTVPFFYQITFSPWITLQGFLATSML